jgi:transposase-like protein
MSKRRTHSPEFKARVAMEAISGRKTIQEIAADHAIHPIQVSSDIRFWSSGDTKTGPPDGLLTGALRRPLDRCFIGGCCVVVVGCGIFAA